jgi:hypothetical protein
MDRYRNFVPGNDLWLKIAIAIIVALDGLLLGVCIGFILYMR